MEPQLMVILYFLTANGVYLGLKHTKHCAGKLVSAGGKVEADETALMAIVREVFDEWGVVVDPRDLKQMALLRISREGAGHEIDLMVYVTKKWTGNFVSSKEIDAPKLYTMSEIKDLNLMPSDKIWLPAILFGCSVEVHITHDEKRENVTSLRMTEKSFV